MCVLVLNILSASACAAIRDSRSVRIQSLNRKAFDIFIPYKTRGNTHTHTHICATKHARTIGNCYAPNVWSGTKKNRPSRYVFFHLVCAPGRVLFSANEWPQAYPGYFAGCARVRQPSACCRARGWCVRACGKFECTHARSTRVPVLLVSTAVMRHAYDYVSVIRWPNVAKVAFLVREKIYMFNWDGRPLWIMLCLNGFGFSYTQRTYL